MIHGRLVRRTAVAFAVLASLAGCAGRAPAEAGAALPPGDIGVPFRNRWWHFYERGLSWSDAGDDRAAEADFRQCLRLRQTDSRRARTYGLHFVQCFAQRELGAVLLRQGRLDEAEPLLRSSQEQEPSAKAELLLQRLHALRLDQPVPPAAPAPDPQRARIEISAVQVAPAGGVSLQGRLVAVAGGVLWLREAGGGVLRIAADAAGLFQLTTGPGASLAIGDANGPLPGPTVPAAAPAAAPELELDGPGDGQMVADGRAWYRWRAASAAGLAELVAEDAEGTVLLRLPLSGLRAAGTLRLDLAGGPQRLRFILRDLDGNTGVGERQVTARPSPQQDRSLRAVALALPLQSPRAGAMRPGDDPRLLAALLDDGRFRLVDRRADAVLAHELSLVEAGLVDRATAAEAGRRMSSRYVIAGTLTRGSRDAECFLRLIHSTSGTVVATADAYVDVGGDEAAEALFTAVAGRLRQTFPVIAGPIVGDSQSLRLAVGQHGGAVVHMRLHVFPAAPEPGQPARPAGQAEIGRVEADQSFAERLDGTIPATGWGISE